MWWASVNQARSFDTTTSRPSRPPFKDASFIVTPWFCSYGLAPYRAVQPNPLFERAGLINGDFDTNIAALLAFPQVAALKTDLSAPRREPLEGVAPGCVFGELGPAQGTGALQLLVGGGFEVFLEGHVA